MILSRDETFRVVCNFRTQSTENEVVGTGIFMSTKNNEPWLITAAHVALSTNINTIIAISDSDSNCITLPLVELNSSLSWKYHSVADLAALPIFISGHNMKYLECRCLPYDHFNLEEKSVSRDCELTSVGFPNGLGVSGKFCPLTFRSYASSALLTLNRADTKTPSDFFCLENPSVGGYSGCPVFDLGYMIVGSMTTTKEKTICYGIMHGTMSDTTGGKSAIVTPTYYLKDLIPFK